MAWIWDPEQGQYVDSFTGTPLSRSQAIEWADESILRTQDETSLLAALVAAGAISVLSWYAFMQDTIKREYIRQFLSSVGGLSQMTEDDWAILALMIGDQYSFLSGFRDDVDAGLLTEAQIAARAKMYINAAREAFEKGHARSTGLPIGSLPAYPGDGSTECLTNCKCYWRIVRIRNAQGETVRWECFWELRVAEHCDDCLHRGEPLAGIWRPYIVEASTARVIAAYPYRFIRRRQFAPDFNWNGHSNHSCNTHNHTDRTEKSHIKVKANA